jgi:hypothetical protein
MMILLLGVAAAIAADPALARARAGPAPAPRHAPMSGPLTGPQTGPLTGPMTGPRTGPMTRPKPSLRGAEVPLGVMRAAARGGDGAMMSERHGRWAAGNRRSAY